MTEPLRVTGVQERAQVVRVEETGEQAVGLVVQLADGTHKVLVFSEEIAGAIREALSGDPA